MNEHGVPDSKLTVLSQAEDHINKNGKHIGAWWCQCDCGSKPFVVVGDSLRRGNTKSCGCLKENYVKGPRLKIRKTNKYDLSGKYGIGWTTNTNKLFYFDLEDYDKIKDYTWVESINTKTQYHYLEAYDKKKKKNVYFVHLIINKKDIDHANRNPLDNRKSNLRESTRSQQNANQKIRLDNTSGVIGVRWRKDRSVWCSYIQFEHSRIHIGNYTDKEDAIRARLQAEAKYFKEFAPQRHLFEQYGIIYENEESDNK